MPHEEDGKEDSALAVTWKVGWSRTDREHCSVSLCTLWPFVLTNVRRHCRPSASNTAFASRRHSSSSTLTDCEKMAMDKHISEAGAKLRGRDCASLSLHLSISIPISLSLYLLCHVAR
jgi:hypothetical protein